MKRKDIEVGQRYAQRAHSERIARIMASLGVTDLNEAGEAAQGIPREPGGGPTVGLDHLGDLLAQAYDAGFTAGEKAGA